MREGSTTLPEAYFATLSTLHKRQAMGTYRAGTVYKRNSGTLWSFICDRTEDGPAWARISKFKTYHDGLSTIIVLIKNYKADSCKRRSVPLLTPCSRIAPTTRIVYIKH